MRSRALGFNPLWINTALKRCSQNTFADPRFNPLWINTALKQAPALDPAHLVSIPYGLTLLSNADIKNAMGGGFQSPMD